VNAPELPRDPFHDGEDFVALARLLWRALDDLDANGIVNAVLALEEEELRALVLMRALLDLLERRREGAR